MKLRLAILGACSAAVLAIAGVAQAHVTVHPNAVPSDSFSAIDVRVPNERPKAATVKVAVQFPAGFLFLSTAPVPGWNAKVIYEKLSKPITVFGTKITQQVDRVVWSGGRIRPGQFLEFPLSVKMPGRPKGAVLTFKALQTYSNGEVVRWIGAPSAETPAPQVLLTGTNDAIADYPAGISAAKKRSFAAARVVGFAVGIPALVLAGIALLGRRRRL